MPKLRSWIALFGCVAGLMAQQPSPRIELQTLQRERVKLLAEALERCVERHRTGTATADVVATAREDWFTAALEAAPSKAEGAKLYDAQIAFESERMEDAQRRFDIGTLGREDLLRAKARWMGWKIRRLQYLQTDAR